MKIVIDCNVLISAGFKDGVCRALLRKVLEKEEIYLSREVILEYLLVLRREKFKAYQPCLEKLVELIAETSSIIEPKLSRCDLPDPSDKKYIDLAISADANFLITGNLIHFPEKKYEKTEIISPREFIDRFLKD